MAEKNPDIEFRKYWREFKNEIFKPLIAFLIVAAIAFIWDLVRHKGFDNLQLENFAFEFFAGTSGGVIVYLIHLVTERSKEIAQAGHHGIVALNEIEAIPEYTSLVSSHIRLPINLQPVFSHFLHNTKEHGGGISLLKVADKDYLDYLELALKSARVSFGATLTDFTPDWFFSNDPQTATKDHKGGPLLAKQKQAYLEMVNTYTKKNSLSAYRVMIFPENALKEAFAKLEQNLKNLRSFFAFHKNLELLFLPSDRVTEISQYEDFVEATKEDYAIIDGNLVIKRNSSTQLTIVLGTLNPKYASFFNQVKRYCDARSPEPFLKKDEIIQRYISKNNGRKVK